MKNIRVLIVDDHGLIRDGLRALLKSEEDIEVVDVAADGEEALYILEKSEVDVVLMDIDMPGRKGFEITQEISQRFPQIKVIALTFYEERGYIQRMLKEGAKGYILKGVEKKELVKAIHQTNDGYNFFSNKVSNIMLENYLTGPPPESNSLHREPSPEELTPREKEILRLIFEEMTNQEIGDRLCISHRTVDSHRRNLLQKIGAKNVVGLVRYAMRHKIVLD